MKSLNSLPKEVAEAVKEVLKAYRQVNVIYEYGKYNVSPDVCYKATYGKDYEYIGTWKDEEVYTLYERMANYKHEFGCLPFEARTELSKEEYKQLSEEK